MNARAVAIVCFVTLLTAGTGLIIGQGVGQNALGLVLGMAVGIPAGVFLVARRRRWVAVAMLNAEFVFSFVVGGLPGLVFSVTAAGLTFFVSASILRELYDGSELEAFQHHLLLALGMVKGFQIVDASRASTSKEAQPLFGPRWILVKTATAVTMELGSRLSRVSGPAMFTSKPYEYVKLIHDLREKQQSFTFDGVITHDLMSTSVTVTITYGLDVADSVRQGSSKLSPTEEAILLGISQRMPNWETATKAALEQAVRQVIGAFSLPEVMRGTRYPHLEQLIWQRTNRSTNPWGIRVCYTTLESVRPKPEVMAAMDNRWTEMARAEGMREALTLLADGYRRAKSAGMTDEQITREVVRRTLEEMAHDPATKFLMAPEMLDLLGSPNAHGDEAAKPGAPTGKVGPTSPDGPLSHDSASTSGG